LKLRSLNVSSGVFLAVWLILSTGKSIGGEMEKHLGDVKCDAQPCGFYGRKVTREELHIAHLDE